MQTKRLILKKLMFAAALLSGAGTSVSQAQTPYPTRPITLVVGFSAGSSIDMVARAVANKLGEKLGQTVVVENKPGAGGNVAAGLIARGTPDGYRLLVVANSIAIAPAVYRELPFDTEKDLRAIAYIGAGPVVLKVSTAKGIRTLQDLITQAKAHPKGLNFGSSGVGGTPHMATVLFNQTAQVQMTHVPYKGGMEALTALMGGDVDVLINPLLGDVASDKVRSIAITGKSRSALAPNVPTFAELGFPGYTMNVYYGIMGPAGLPDPVVRKLTMAVNEVLAMPATTELLTTRSGIELKPQSAEAFQRFIQEDIARWKAIAKDDPSVVVQ